MDDHDKNEGHEGEPMTEAGQHLQEAVEEFLDIVESDGVDPDQIMSELIAISSGAIINASLAEHNGIACSSCLSSAVGSFVATINDAFLEIAKNQNTGSVH